MQEPGYMRAPRLHTTPHPYTKTAMRAFATAMFGLRLALRLFEKTNNDVTPTSTVSNELLHVHRVREGERVAKASPSPVSHHAHCEGEGIVIKLPLVVRVT